MGDLKALYSSRNGPATYDGCGCENERGAGMDRWDARSGTGATAPRGTGASEDLLPGSVGSLLGRERALAGVIDRGIVF